MSCYIILYYIVLFNIVIYLVSSHLRTNYRSAGCFVTLDILGAEVKYGMVWYVG